MFVNNIRLYNFRNYNKLELKFEKKINIFLGENGQGKTNLMEAIYILSQGQSFRPGKTSTLVKKNEIQSYCKVNVTSKKITTLLTLQILEERKKFFVNQKPTSSTKTSTFLKTIMFSPESLSVIKDGPDKRRALVDETIALIDPDGKFLLAEFKKCHKMRNKLLKDHKVGQIERVQFLDVLESLNKRYLPLCLNVAQSRIKALKGLLPYIKDSMKTLFPDKNVDISVEYLSHSKNILNYEHYEMTNLFKKRMAELEMAEIDAGISLFGPQKHDIIFLFDQNDSRYFCSQGQQRALILSVKMAEVLYYYNKFEDYPILILDDVMSELDEKRREYLLEFLSEVKGQIFLSTTDLSAQENFFKNKKDIVSVFKINNGNIKE